MYRKIVYPDADANSLKVLSGTRRKRLDALGAFEIYCDEAPEDNAMIERLSGAQAALSGWGLSNAVLAELPDLEVISFTGLGASTFIDIAEAKRRNITVTHTLSAATTIAEHTLGLMLDAARHISRLDRDLRDGNWNTSLMSMDLNGKTLGLVGFGRIAQALLPMVKALGMRVIVSTRNPDPERAVRHGIEFVDLDELMATSDVISLHLLSTPQTDGLITGELLRSSRPGVLLVNTARASLLDEATFFELLGSGHIRSAGIDVFDDEPIAADHPCLELDNIVMTPHVGYNSPEAIEEMYDTAIDNLVAFYAGQPQNVAAV